MAGLLMATASDAVVGAAAVQNTGHREGEVHHGVPTAAAAAAAAVLA